MKLIRVPPTPQDCYLFKKISECQRVEIGVYPVVFGYRIRAGFAGEQFVELDYCAGNRQEDVEYIFQVVEHVLSQHEFSYAVFDGFPRQHQKPFMNDQENWPLFQALMPASEPVELLNLATLRLLLMPSNWVSDIFFNMHIA